MEMNPEARTFGMLCHLLALIGFVLPGWGTLSPLIFWLVQRDKYPLWTIRGRSRSTSSSPSGLSGSRCYSSASRPAVSGGSSRALLIIIDVYALVGPIIAG